MPSLGVPLLTVVIISLITLAMFSLKKKWKPAGKHCYVTGGSSGLGKALSILLARKGAHVSIVARGEERLQKALAELEKARQSPEQIFQAFSYSLIDSGSSAAALETVCKAHGGRNPDAVFLCAGGSAPRFFVEENEETLRKGMDNAYWIQAWTALAVTKRMVRDRSRGKIIFVSSVLGYMSVIGYSSYSPGKHALRGLAETLRSELLLYPIDVHIYFPGTIYTPGYEEENKTKPRVTLKIEETDDGLQPEPCAKRLFEGVGSGHFHITADLIGHIFRSSTRGATPQNNVFMDTIYGLIGWVGLPLWRRSVDSTVQRHRQEHEEYLVGKRENL